MPLSEFVGILSKDGIVDALCVNRSVGVATAEGIVLVAIADSVSLLLGEAISLHHLGEGFDLGHRIFVVRIWICGLDVVDSLVVFLGEEGLIFVQFGFQTAFEFVD